MIVKKRIHIIGGGPSALALASELDPEKFEVCLYEKNVAMGRKFLVAGQGGFNLTHSEDPQQFIHRYTPSDFLTKAFFTFTNHDLVNWLKFRGIETRIGSSGRVFPKLGIKPIQVLNVLLNHLRASGVALLNSRTWKGFSESGDLLFETKKGIEIVKSDITVFCLGGASWPQTGSKGDWAQSFINRGIKINPFQASNCAFEIKWPKELLSKIEGKAIKNAVFTCGNRQHAGEVVLTQFGIEGSGIYPLSPEIRKGLESANEVDLSIDFKPSLSADSLIAKLNVSRTKGSYSKHIQTTLNLSDTQLMLLKYYLNKEDFLNSESLLFFIKHFPLRIIGTGPVSEAISTVGGIALEELNEYFEFKKIKNTFAIGEMLDFDAPTGGYWLQSCFSMGHFLAKHLNACN